MQSQHVLKGVLYPGWEQNIPDHVHSLADLLGISVDTLNYQATSLPLVESAIVARWHDRTLGDLRSKLFSPLLAYTGEIVRRSVNGDWLIIGGKTTDTLEPWIIDSLQQKYCIMGILDPFFGDMTALELKAMVEVIPKLPERRKL